jgi:hypothetical protein
LAQILVGRGLSVATVDDPAPFRGAAAADLGVALGRPGATNPANRHRAVPLTYEQFRYGFANAVMRRGQEAYAHLPCRPPALLFQAATANFNRGRRRRSTARTRAGRC